MKVNICIKYDFILIIISSVLLSQFITDMLSFMQTHTQVYMEWCDCTLGVQFDSVRFSPDGVTRNIPINKNSKVSMSKFCQNTVRIGMYHLVEV